MRGGDRAAGREEPVSAHTPERRNVAAVEDNAALLRAAPDLLSACEYAIAWLMMYAEQPFRVGGEDELLDMLLEARNSAKGQ